MQRTYSSENLSKTSDNNFNSTSPLAGIEITAHKNVIQKRPLQKQDSIPKAEEDKEDTSSSEEVEESTIEGRRKLRPRSQSEGR